MSKAFRKSIRASGASTIYPEIQAVEHLVDAGHTVSVVNPVQVKAFAGTRLTRDKTPTSPGAAPPAAPGRPRQAADAVIRGAMMRKLLCVAYDVLCSGRPFDPALHPVAG